MSQEEPERPNHDREGDRGIRESDLPGSPLTPYRPPPEEREPPPEKPAVDPPPEGEDGD